jgi:hypothetical protein
MSDAAFVPGADTALQSGASSSMIRDWPWASHWDSGAVSSSDENADFSDAFCAFLQLSVTTINAAELLLLLFNNAETAWNPRELAAKLEPLASLTEPEVAKHLELFQQRGLIVRAEGDQVRYQPASGEVDSHVRTLSRLYNERPVTLIRVIYALRDTKIKTFADAFTIFRG